jgi:Cu-processing system ATP-binding protein
MFRLRDISKSFGAAQVLGPVDLDIRKGEWLGLFGHNGSGKTTLIRILLGLTPPSRGTLLLDGVAPTKGTWQELQRQLGFMPERVQFYEGMTGREVLEYFAKLRGAEEERLEYLLERVNLASAADRKVGGYSKGMRQRLNLAQALLGRPDVLVLDEPVEGLDPVGVRSLFELLRDEGVPTVVIASHLIGEVSRQVDRVCILEDGLIRAEGTVDELVASIAVPVRVHIFAHGEMADLDSVLAGVGARRIAHGDGKLVLEVDHSQKASLIFALHAFRELIYDLRVEDVGIEDLWRVRN